MQRPLTGGRRLLHHAALRRLLPLALALLLLLPGIESAFAHAVAEGDKGYIKEITGVHLLPFVYLGAKHMVTGYDHILFLFGVIFFLYRAKHIAIYVSLFALGHSTTMLLGVYFNVGPSDDFATPPPLIDPISLRHETARQGGARLVRDRRSLP